MPWSVLDAFDDLGDVGHNFEKMLHAVWDKHAPIKQRLRQAAPFPWMTGDIVCMTMSRDAVFRNYLCVKTDALSHSSRSTINAQLP